MTSTATRRRTSSRAEVSGPSLLDWLDGPTIAPSGQEVAPANPFRRPAKGAEPMIQGICGRTFIGSSVPDGHLSSWESRLRERLAAVGSTESALIWRETTTPAGLSISRLAPSTVHSNGTASGGSRWPAPATPNGGRALNSAGVIAGHRPDGSKLQIPLESLMRATALWAAVTARDCKNANAKRWVDRGGGKKGEQLVNQIAHLAPVTAHGGLTPSGLTASTGRRGGANPEFACWLMGFPAEWVSGAWRAMQSRRSSRRK